VRDFRALPLAQQPECLRRLLEEDSAEATQTALLVLSEMAPADGGAMLGRMLGSVHLPPDEAAEATGAALGCVSAEVRAKGVELGLLGHSSPAQVGAALAAILMRLHEASVRPTRATRPARHPSRLSSPTRPRILLCPRVAARATRPSTLDAPIICRPRSRPDVAGSRPWRRRDGGGV